jgi:hypothetical protein
MSAEEIVEQIMTMHWDMAACPCWICKQGRELGLHARSGYQYWRGKLSQVWTKDQLDQLRQGGGK